MQIFPCEKEFNAYVVHFTISNLKSISFKVKVNFKIKISKFF